MSIQTPPDCECAGFNPVCFGALTGDPTGLNPNDYLLFPIGQGVETLPALINTGDIDAGSNIILDGTAGVDGIEFPDNTKQYTAYLGSGQLQQIIPFTPYTLPTGGANNAFNQAIILSYLSSTISTYNVLVFSGGGQSNIFGVSGDPAVPNTPVTFTVPGTSASGSAV